MNCHNLDIDYPLLVFSKRSIDATYQVCLDFDVFQEVFLYEPIMT
jgi:hypothetical protein